MQLYISPSNPECISENISHIEVLSSNQPTYTCYEDKTTFSYVTYTPTSPVNSFDMSPRGKNCKIIFEDCVDFSEIPSLKPDENLIALLRQVMKSTFKTQKMVAKEVGVPPTTMSRYINNKTKPSGWNKMERKLKRWISGLGLDYPVPRVLSANQQ